MQLMEQTLESPMGFSVPPGVLPFPGVLCVCSPDQQHQHHLETAARLWGRGPVSHILRSTRSSR